MELAPIAGIRAVSLLQVHRAQGALPPAFTLDGLSRVDDETYSARREAAARGLEEDEDGLDEMDDLESKQILAGQMVRSRISYFV